LTRRAAEIRKLAAKFSSEAGSRMATVIADECERRAAEARKQEIARIAQAAAEDTDN